MKKNAKRKTNKCNSKKIKLKNERSEKRKKMKEERKKGK